jgi:hypothetical protein
MQVLHDKKQFIKLFRYGRYPQLEVISRSKLKKSDVIEPCGFFCPQNRADLVMWRKTCTQFERFAESSRARQNAYCTITKDGHDCRTKARSMRREPVTNSGGFPPEWRSAERDQEREKTWKAKMVELLERKREKEQKIVFGSLVVEDLVPDSWIEQPRSKEGSLQNTTRNSDSFGLKLVSRTANHSSFFNTT